MTHRALAPFAPQREKEKERRKKIMRDLLQEAIDFCAARGLTFDQVNRNDPTTIESLKSDPRKVSANYYIDDRAGAYPFEPTYIIHLRGILSNLPQRSIVAVDFDGTLCRHKWPNIGEPNLPLIQELIGIKRRGYRLTLWTCREHPHPK